MDGRSLADTIANGSAKVGVIGLGYVGLPLAVTIAQAGLQTIGFDIDLEKVKILNRGESYIDSITSRRLTEIVKTKRFRASADFSELTVCDVIVICVPTPLTRNRDPDLSYVINTAECIAEHMRRAQLIVLESTTFPGTTTEIVKPILEKSGLQNGVDFFLGFSPEREDPGNSQFATVAIPKVVAGDGGEARYLVESFFKLVVQSTVPVSTPAVAEAVKMTENIFRAVNIALVNELKIIYDAMGIDIWEVIDAAATKPFGYMAFYPGPGLGGHCIPIDPFYLAWKAKEHELPTRFIELAGEINLSMPRYVVSRLESALDRHLSLPLGRAQILLLGIAYKRNVSDVRESPSFRLLSLLEQRGAVVEFNDPHVPIIPMTREHPEFAGRKSIDLTADVLRSRDCVLVAIDHEAVDYQSIAQHSRLIVDTRNVFARRGLRGDHIIKA